MRKTALILSVLAIVLAITPLASAASISWNGATNSWGVSAAWNLNRVPTSLDDVTVNINHQTSVTLGQNWEVNSLTNSQGDAIQDFGVASDLTAGYGIKIWTGNFTVGGNPANFALTLRAALELGNNGTWALNGRTVNMYGALTGAYSLTKTGVGGLNYQNNSAPTTTDLNLNGGWIQWTYGGAAFTGGFGTGTISVNNGSTFVFSDRAGTGGVINITNPINIGSAGGAIKADNLGNTRVEYSGTINMGGNLFIGGNSNATESNTIRYSGTIVVDQSVAGQRFIVANGAGDSSGQSNPEITGNIVDGAGSSGNPLFIKMLEYRANGGRGNLASPHLNISGNSTYANGTVIDTPTQYTITNGAVDGNYGLVNVTNTNASQTPLGTGLTTMLAGARLRLASSLNIPGKVSVQSNNLMLGVLSLNFAANSASLSSLVTADSSGVLALATNSQTFTTLDQSTIGNGKMFIGSDELNAATLSATTILPGYDDVGGLTQTYRFGGGSGGSGNSSGLLLGMNLSQTTSRVVIGSPLLNGASGSVMMSSANQRYSLGLTVNPGSTLNLTSGATGSPVGTGTVTLKGGAIGVPGAYYGGTYAIPGGIDFTGASTFFDVGQSNSSNVFNVDHLVRTGTGQLFLGSLTVNAGAPNQIKVTNNAPGHTNPNAAMVDPYITIAGGATFADYVPSLTNIGGINRIGFINVTFTGTGATVGSWTSDTIASVDTAGTLSLAGATSAYALRVNQSTMNLNGNTLNISSGGLIMYGAGNALITSSTGTLSFATTTGTPVEAVITATGADQPNRVFQIDPIINNAAGLTASVYGWGSLKLTNTNNSFTGNVTMNSGWLEYAGDDRVFGNSANQIVLNGGGLYMNAGGTFTTNRQIVLGQCNAHVYASSTGVMVLGGTISGSGILDVNPDMRTANNGSAADGRGGHVVLAGNNSYSGGTIIRNGGIMDVNASGNMGTGDVQVEYGSTLNLKGTTNVADTALLTVSYGGVVNLQSAGETIGGLAGPGQINLGAAAGGGNTVLTLGGNQSSTFYGTLGQTGTAVGSLVKGGTGSLIWRGVRSYTGTTTVANGTLDVAGVLTGNVNVASQDGIVSPILKLSNNLTGNVAVTGGLISVGTAPTIKTIGGLSFSTTTVASQVELDTFSNSQTAGVGYDRLVVTGTANMNNSQLLIKIAPTTNFIGDVMTILTSGSDMTGETLSAKFIGGFGTLAISPDGHAVTLSKIAYAGDADQDGTVGGSDYTQWLNNFGVTGATWTQADLDGDGTVGGSDYAIWLNNFGVSQSDYGPAGVPEPATMCLLALGGAALLRRRK